ncbi:MAG: Kelch repeat-containing protein, partial [Candidatus Polarisedimenticolia bacterium]
PLFTPVSVNGTLTIRQGLSILAVLPAANGPISIVPFASAAPAGANSSLNFNWSSPASGTVTMELDLSSPTAGITAIDPAGQNFTFVHNKRFRVQGVRLQYDHDGNPFTPPTKTPNPSLVSSGLDWFRKSGPLAPCKLSYWVNPTPLQTTFDLSSMIDPGPVRATLAGMKVLGSVTYDQVYGWWQGGVSGNGYSMLPGTCASPAASGAYGNTDPTRYVRTFTHEVYHNYHQVHYADGGANWVCDAHPGSDFGSGQIGLVGWDTALHAPVPSSKLDVMVPGQLTSAAWQDAARYSYFWNLWDDPSPEPILDPCHFNWWQLYPFEFFVPYGPLLPEEEELPPIDVLVVSGLIDPSGFAEILPAWRLMRATPAVPPSPIREEPYRLQLIDRQGQVIEEHPIEVDFHGDAVCRADGRGAYGRGDSPEPSPEAFSFTLKTPVTATGELDLSEIRLLHDGVLAGLRRVSPGVPAVQILAPDPRAMPDLDQPFEIRWAATDPDGDPLYYSVQYSPDNGLHYLALVAGLMQPVYVGNPDELPGGTQVLLRVTATDGVNTAETEMGPFRLPRKGPEVIIESPEMSPPPDDSVPVFAECRDPFLAGSGMSPDDGVLPGDMLEWFSDLQGSLGTGYAPPNPCLRAGEHVITLVGTDKAGERATDQIRLRVVPEGQDGDADGTPDYADVCETNPGPPGHDGCPYDPENLPLEVKVEVVDAMGMPRPPPFTADSFFDVFFDVVVHNPRPTDVRIEAINVLLHSGTIGDIRTVISGNVHLVPAGGALMLPRVSFFDVSTAVAVAPGPPEYGEYAIVFELLEGPNMPAGRGGASFLVAPTLGDGCRPIQVGGPSGWTAKSPMPDAREGATGVIIGKKIFVTHGEAAGVPDTSTNYVYEIPTDSWGAAAPAFIRRAELAGVCIEDREGRGQLFAAGGRQQASGAVLADTELYDPATDTWSPLPPMPTARRGAGAAFVPGNGVANGRLGSVYVIGGSDGPGPHAGTPFDANEAFDVEVGVWVRRAPMPRPEMDVYSTLWFPGNGMIYVFGGYNGGGVDDLVQVYDPVGDSWSLATPMPTRRSNLIAGICGGRVHVLGGFDGAAITGLNEFYNPLSDTWAPAPGPAKPTPAAELASQFIYTGTDIFAIGGIAPGGAGPTPANEVFTCGATPPFCHSDAECDDRQFCNGRETSDLGSGQCLPGTPPTCDDGDLCTDDRCEPTANACLNVPLPDSDGDGLCDPIDCAPQIPGTPIPGPIGNTAAAKPGASPGEVVILWSSIPVASHYNTYRGTIPAALLGSRLPMPPYDHACFESADAQMNGPTETLDGEVPRPGTAYYYEMTGENGCGEGPLGQASSGVVRPNPFPCPTPP